MSTSKEQNTKKAKREAGMKDQSKDKEGETGAMCI
jgi:hypothetical protein